MGILGTINNALEIFVASELAMALFIVILANVNSFIITIIASIILGMFTKGTAPINKTMLTESIEHLGNFERTFGINGVIASIAVTIAPITLGLISNKYSIVSAFNISALFAIIASIPAIAFHFERKRQTRQFLDIAQTISEN